MRPVKKSGRLDSMMAVIDKGLVGLDTNGGQKMDHGDNGLVDCSGWLISGFTDGCV